MTTNESLQSLQATMRGLFPELLGIRLTEATPERVAAEMPGRDELCTLPGTIHGGALMALADTVGAYATAINLPQGAGTTTIESKTNFFARATPGKPIRAVATVLECGLMPGTRCGFQCSASGDVARLIDGPARHSPPGG